MSARIGYFVKDGFKSVHIYNTKEMVKIVEFLMLNYADKTSLKKLINGGDIHSLSEKVTYFTDLGDDPEYCKPMIDSVFKVKDIDVMTSPVDYFLAFDKRWYVSPGYELNAWKTAEKFIKYAKVKNTKP